MIFNSLTFVVFFAVVLVLARADEHPQLATAAVQVATAQTGAGLARAAYRPDWRVELGYGHRPAFAMTAEHGRSV